MTCFHGSSAEKFSPGSVCNCLLSQHQLGSVRDDNKRVEVLQKFDTDHWEFMTDPKFGEFVFAVATTLYLNNNVEENTNAKCVVTILLHMGIRIKYLHTYRLDRSNTLEHEGNEVKYKKYLRAINADGDRGIINCLSCETKIFCECMKPKKAEAKNMKKRTVAIDVTMCSQRADCPNVRDDQ